MTQSKDIRHFLDICDLSTEQLRAVVDNALAMKQARAGAPKGAREPGEPLKDRLIALIFEKPSTRTRVSFDVAMRQMGGDTLMLSSAELQLGRGETVSDTARVLSRMVDAIMIRSGSHESVVELAELGSVPVINGLTPRSHPCQIMADLMTLKEHTGRLEDAVVAWSGDANNVARSWLHAAARLGFEFRIACPAEFSLPEDELAWARNLNSRIAQMDAPADAADGAHCVVTDAWVSMGDSDVERRTRLLTPYRVDADLMKCARDDAIFMHCLPAYRGREVSAEVIDGPQSVVFDEAENRLHAQKAILGWCLGG